MTGTTATATQRGRPIRTLTAGRAWLAGLLLAGCIGSNPPYRLYPNPEHERPIDEVAILVGDVAIVDGSDVAAHGGTFALEPGCHIVGTPKRYGGTSNSATFWADVGQISFAMDMKAHYRYVVRIDVAITNGTGGRVSVSGREELLDGTVTREFPAIRGRPVNGSCARAGASTPAETR